MINKGVGTRACAWLASLAAVSMVVIGAPLALADTIVHTGAFKTAVQYDTNPRMLPDDEAEAVWLGLLQPMYRGYWIDGPSRWQLDVELRMERASNQRVISNREDPTVELFWKYRGQRNDINFTAYSSAMPLRLVEFEETGNVFSDGTRIANVVEGEWKHQWNQRTSVEVGSRYTYTRYEETALVNYEELRSDLIGRYEVSERLEASAEMLLSYIEPKASPDLTPDESQPSNLQGVMVGSRYEISPLWDLGLKAGLVRSEKSETENFANGEARLAYAGERLSAEASLSRLTTASGFAGFLTGDTLQAKVSYDYGVRTVLEALASLRQNRSPTDNRTNRVELVHRYKLDPVWTLRSSWQYKQVTSSEELEGQIFMVTLEFSPG